MKKRIKIVFAVNPNIFGGVERSTFNLIKYLNKRYFRPEILSLERGPALTIFKQLKIPVIVPKYKKYPSISQLAKLLKDLKADILQLNMFSGHMLLAGRQAKIPIVLRIGGHNKLMLSHIKPEKRNCILSLIMPLPNAMVCPSLFLKSQFNALKPKNILVIPNGVDFLEINKYLGMKKHGTSNKPFTIGMAAAFIPSKKHRDLINAAKIIKNKGYRIKVLFMGSAYPNKISKTYAGSIRHSVKRLNLSDEICFLGFRRDIFKIISGMDILVMPACDEGASNAIIEAMALAKPVIAANSGGNAEFIRDRKDGFLFAPGDYRTLANRIEELMLDIKLKNQIGLAARSKARKLFNAAAMTKKHENLYFNLCYNRKPEDTKPRTDKQSLPSYKNLQNLPSSWI